VKAFTIRPQQPIRGTILEFGGRDTEESIIRGYLDAAARIVDLAKYVETGGFKKERQVLVVQILKPGA
jgi:hypothetical protein